MPKKLTKSDCDITIIAEVDDIPVRGNAMASGDDIYDKEVEDEIISRLNNGDVWAWANVTITASWSGLYGSDNLGGCSYKNEDDFINSGHYYDSMVDAAVNDLNNKIAKIFQDTKPLNEKHG